MVAIGTLGTVISAIELLREVLEKSGIDRSKAAQIAGEFMAKLRPKGGTAGGPAKTADTSAAFSEESWEYSVVTLAYQKRRKGPRSLVPVLRDGIPLPHGEPAELAAWLNRAAAEGWETWISLGGEEAPTLILRREER